MRYSIMNLKQALTDMQSKHAEIELNYSECVLIGLIKPAFKRLATKLPNKRLELSMGGMGSNMFLSVETRHGSYKAKPMRHLEGTTGTNSRYDYLFSELCQIQVYFNDAMAMGLYPSLGTILYNPVTGTIEYNNDEPIYINWHPHQGHEIVAQHQHNKGDTHVKILLCQYDWAAQNLRRRW